MTYRKVNQGLRRAYMSMRPKLRHKLWVDIMILVNPRGSSNPDWMTDEEREKVSAIHWRMGSGNIYHFTPEQDAMECQIIDKILAERNAK